MVELILKNEDMLLEDEQEKEKNIRVLIVDDEERLRDTLKEILDQSGYETDIVQTGKEALKMCQVKNYDVAIIDIKLPDIDGTKLLEALKRLYPSLIKIMITGYPSLENAIASLNLGAEAYIVKPFKPRNLLDEIKKQLDKRQKAKWENLLKKTGLSAYETKIYLSLTYKEASGARDLSMTSGVPRTKAYAAIKKLLQRGLIIEFPGDPKRYSIAPPSSGFDSFIQNWKKELSEQNSTLVELENTLSTLDTIHKEKQETEPWSINKEEVWSIQGHDEVMEKIEGILSKAKKAIGVITTEEGLFFISKNFGKALDSLALDGVKIKIKVPIGESNINFVRDLRHLYKVENMQVSVPILFVIVDSKEMFLSNLTTNDSSKEFGLFSQDSPLIPFFYDLLGFGK